MIDDARSLIERSAAAMEEGRLPAKVFHHPGVFELEKQRIFGRSWVFLAHESEIPRPRDYVLRYIVNDSFIVSRDDAGTVRVLLNTCRHRGSQVCRAEAGNASHFRCPYHGWTYRNSGELTGVPHAKTVYGEGFDRSRWGLMELPRVDQYQGLIFGNCDRDAESLETYMAGAQWYFDFYTRKSEAGLEVIGPPHRWVVPADWKLGADNFIGDAYHTSFSHYSVVAAGILMAPDADFHLNGPQWVTDRAGGGFMPIPPGSYAGYPPAIVDSWKRNLSAEQWDVVEKKSLLATHSTLFPNLSFLNAASVPDPGPPIPWLTIRQWRPLGPGKTEIWSWFLVEKDLPEEFKAASRRSYVFSFGSSGTTEQDDAENWASISRMAEGELARELYLNYQMGVGHLEPIADWPGPGKAYPIDYTEFAQRRFWKVWLDCLTGASS